MTSTATDGYRRAYAHWLRTGRWLGPYGPDGRELKFNPYHDPRNGQFTFAPGGPRSLSRILVVDRGKPRCWIEASVRRSPERTAGAPPDPTSPAADPELESIELAQRGSGPRMPRGNYIDRQVRRALRLEYNKFGIEYSGKGPVRINAREPNSSETDLIYRRPDARVGDVAFDVTIAMKTIKTAQVRGFFQTDWRPTHVVIVRPSQLGGIYTYNIPRPENGQ